MAAIRISESTLKFPKEGTDEQNIHLLPCEINHNGEANVKDYFQKTVKKEDGETSIPDVYKASLRGRPLQGRQLNLPSGYKGDLKKICDEPFGVDSKCNFRSIAMFASIIKECFVDDDFLTGVILKEPRKRYTEDEERILHVDGSFSKLTYWNLDTLPSENDSFMKALQWIDIASALHARVEEDSQRFTPSDR